MESKRIFFRGSFTCYNIDTGADIPGHLPDKPGYRGGVGVHRGERQGGAIAIACAREIFQTVKANPGSFGPSCGLVACPDPLKNHSHGAPSAQTFEVNAAHIILETIRRLETHARAAPERKASREGGKGVRQAWPH